MSKRIFAPLALTAIAALLVVGTPRAADWLEQPALHAVRAPQSLLLASTVAGKRWLAAGERGVIIWSDDQAASWAQADVPVSVTLTGLSFVSPDQGWAIGHDGIVLQTTDAGQNWKKLADGNKANELLLAEAEANLAKVKVEVGEEPADDAQRTRLEEAEFALEDAQAAGEFGPSRPLLGVKFTNADEGYVVGAFGQVLHTADGGKTWESWTTRLNNPSRLHCNQITVTAEGTLLIASESGTLFRSTDHGASFETINVGYDGPLYGALSLDSGRVLLAYGFAGNAFRSDDGGATWSRLEPLARKSLVSGIVAPDGTPLLLSQDRQLLRGDAAGQQFSKIEVPGGGPVASMALTPDAGAAILVGFGGASAVKLR